MKYYTALLEKYKREKIGILLAAGPSLYDLYMSDFYNKIYNHLVISVNSSIIIAPWNKGSDEKRIWISNDALTRKWDYFKKVKTCKAHKIVRNSWKKYYDEIPDFYVFKPRKTSEDIINYEEKGGLAYCGSTCTALDLLIQIGCEEIYIFGLDHNEGPQGEKHFFEFFDRRDQPTYTSIPHGSWKQRKQVFQINNQSYKALKGFAEYKNCKIYNCSITSKLDVFEKIRFQDAGKKLK